MTRVEVLTARGAGAIAVAAVRGEGAAEMLRAAFRRRSGGRLARFEPGRTYVGTIEAPSGEVADEVVLAALPGGDFEVCGHGGGAATARLFRALRERGAIEESAVGTPAPLAARARTWLAFRVLFWRDEGILDRSWDRTVEALERPRRVVLAGAPNAGKSSLFNALLDRDRSIVSPEPGTTRDVIEEECALFGVPLVLCDVAGDGEIAPGELDRAGVERARRAAEQADIVVEVIDGSLPRRRPRPGARSAGTLLSVLSKSDLPHAFEMPGALRVSARNGDGLDRLGLEIATRALGRDPRHVRRPAP